jgi:hypothetical protein
MEEALQRYIQRKLAPGKGGRFQTAVPLAEGVRADGILRTDDTLYLIEEKQKSSDTGSVAQLALYRDLLETSHPDIKVVPVLASHSVAPGVKRLLEKIGGKLVEIPAGLSVRPDDSGTRIPLTTEQSWRVICALLRSGASKSLRSLAKESGVSLGWVYRVVRELRSRSIAESGKSGISIVNGPKLLDVIAFERPLDSLVRATFRLNRPSAHEAAMEISRTLGANKGATLGEGFSFCGETAAGIHSGYSVRRNSADLYLEGRELGRVLQGMHEPKGKIQIQVLMPDRPACLSGTLSEGVKIVSEDMALLDTAGLGFRARDLTLKLMERLREHAGH